MNKNRITASVLTTVLLTGIIGSGTCNVSAAEVTNEKKEEVIYVMTNPDGSVDSVNVVNIFGKGAVKDYGNYSSVRMLTSTDDIEQNKDKITFSTQKDRVYYQGTLENAQIPWNIEITGTLDGKKLNLEDLAGKSGALKLHISITENKKCKKNFYDDYALQANFTLATSKCKNIIADGATIANAGADKQINYTVLPGKGLEADITADVTDFEMDAASINGIMLNLDIDIDNKELMDKVSEIQDAAVQLRDGSDSLDDSIDTLNSGVVKLQDGLEQLNGKSGQLTNGSSQVLKALQKIQKNLKDMSVSNKQLKELRESSARIKKGITKLDNGAEKLQSSLSYETYKNTMKEKGLDIEQLKLNNTQALTSLQEQTGTLEKTILQLKSNPAYKQNEELQTQAAQLEKQLENLKNIVTLLYGNNAAIDGTEKYFGALRGGADSLAEGLESLGESYETFDTAIEKLTNGLSGMTVNMTELKAGIDTLVTQYSTLDNGVTEYTNGVANVVDGYSTLVDGTTRLADGSKSMVSGTNEFYDKTSDMDTEVTNRIDDMMNSISGGDRKTVSFASDKNKQVSSVQFVIKTCSIKKKERKEVVTTEKRKNFWEKLKALF